MSAGPGTLVEALERAPSLPAGAEERFGGYGVMGLPFASGHVLAMRRFVASSVGDGYTSVWHRTPDGAWRFYSTVAPRLACTRYFGAIATEAVETEIALTWDDPFHLRLAVAVTALRWTVALRASPATRLMNLTGGRLPARAWRSPVLLSAMELAAGPLLGVGRIGLQGRVPNGQRFVANPRLLWMVEESRAELAGTDLGPPGPVRPQAALGDFRIPQRGIFAIGGAFFETFDPARHSADVCGAATAARPTAHRR